MSTIPPDDCSSLLCADNPLVPGESACSGDSGGPLVCLKGDHWVQAGVTSHVAVINTQRGAKYRCNHRIGDHTMYTAVAKFRGWIDGVMKS